MDADFSIELGKEDPALDFPWKDPAGRLAYVDLKRQPGLISQVEEAVKSPELAEFLPMGTQEVGWRAQSATRGRPRI